MNLFNPIRWEIKSYTSSDDVLCSPVWAFLCNSGLLGLKKFFTVGNGSSLQKVISRSFELCGRWISLFPALFTNCFVLTLFQQNKCFFTEIFVVQSKATEPVSRIITTTYLRVIYHMLIYLPHQSHGHQGIETRIDLWSLSVVVFFSIESAVGIWRKSSRNLWLYLPVAKENSCLSLKLPQVPKLLPFPCLTEPSWLQVSECGDCLFPHLSVCSYL